MDDRLDAEVLELQVDETGKVWVNVDGICVLRIGRVKTVYIDDPERGLHEASFDEASTKL